MYVTHVCSRIVRFLRRTSVFTRALFSASVITLVIVLVTACSTKYPKFEPGPASAIIDGNNLELLNSVISFRWSTTGGKLRPLSLTDRFSRRTLTLDDAEAFVMVQQDGRRTSASDFRVVGQPTVSHSREELDSSILALRSPGQEIVVQLATPDGALTAEWRATLRDGSHFIRQAITLRGSVAGVASLAMIHLPVPDGKMVGEVSGSPIVAGGFFFGMEHPLSQCTVEDSRAHCSLSLSPSSPFGQPIYSAIAGVTPEDQIRRGFLRYLERERAQPFRQFLHYNSWYDIRSLTESACKDVVFEFGEQLAVKRDIRLDALVWDDGWEDTNDVWHVDRQSFPSGLEHLAASSRRFGSHLGFWMSPWGGYGERKTKRLASGISRGLETIDSGFSLSGPRYYEYFVNAAVTMIQKNDANYLKFDGVEATRYDQTEALFQLIRDLRRIKPDLFVNLTTGTWPSPFWLLAADSIWRGGADTAFAGSGSKREQWITYRDTQTYRSVVRKAPLFPLSALMLHGVVNARLGLLSEVAVTKEEMRHEIRSYFGSGAALQELYVSPSLMTAENWNDLAEAIRWSRANSDVLADSHWVGGDPGLLQPYGWASWSPRKGLLVLRNPDDQASAIAIDVAEVFELPSSSPRRFSLRSPWKENTGSDINVVVQAGRNHLFKLAPFEVLVLDAIPAN